LVRIVESRFDDARVKVAQRLKELSEAGCDVKVISRIEPSMHSPGSKVKSNLGDNLIVLPYQGPTPKEQSVNAVHAKIVMIDAVMTGSPDRERIVMAGSHNLNGTSLKDNDEVVLKMSERTIFDSYLKFWNRIYDDAVAAGSISR
jgi:phosphatidylserine/phosphatidylglycerophosphate/cardiolipin synthase-like enzyme